MDATSWATLWALIGLLIFLAIMIYVKAPGMAAKMLDERAKRIADELDEARRLRDEAQQILTEYQKKRQAAEAEANEIIAAAKREADLLVEDAKRKSDEYVARRTATAEQKIAQAERVAIAEVRASAVDLAVAAARKVLQEKVDGGAADTLFRSALDSLKTRLN
jgi:F-type H+-transporting ATPase subunit b